MRPPYLRLSLETQDEVNLTPTQLLFWQVTFQEAPEGILLEQDSTSQEAQPTTWCPVAGEVWPPYPETLEHGACLALIILALSQ